MTNLFAKSHQHTHTAYVLHLLGRVPVLPR